MKKQKQIYLDNAATTKISPKAMSLMISLMKNGWANSSSLHTFGQKSREVLKQARETIAAIIGAASHEIIFTSGGTESDNQAILSAATLGLQYNKKHIITSAFEHHAVLHSLDKFKQQGFDITLLDVHDNGIVRPEEVRAAIRPDTCLVTIMYANNEIGTIQPIAEIGSICKEYQIPFHVDAVQAIGHIPINVIKDNIDMLSASAHKFHGPKGVGFLYAKRGITLTPLIIGGRQERELRAGTENVPAIATMAEALKESSENMSYNIAKVSSLRNMLIKGLLIIPGSVLNGDITYRLPSNVNMCFKGANGQSLLAYLNDKNILVSTGSACTSGTLDPSHVLLSIGRTKDEARSAIRFSLGEELMPDDIDYVIKTTHKAMRLLKYNSSIY